MHRSNILLLLLVLLVSCIVKGVFSSRCECLEKIVLLHNQEDFRIIASPEYPRPYCSNIDCIWRIVAPDNTSKAYFYADNLDLRELDDQILFYDSAYYSEIDNDTESSHSCTGDEICRFASSGQYMTIRFKTANGLIDKYGFQGIASAKDKPVYALLSVVQHYCYPLSVLFLIILALFISIICCKRNSSKTPQIKPGRDEKMDNSRILLE